MKKLLVAIGVIVLMVWTACTTNSDDVVAEAAPLNQLVIDEPGYKMNIMMPEEYIGRLDKCTSYDHDLGQLNIQVDDKFAMEIKQGTTSLKEMKNNLNNEQLFTYQFSYETPQGFIYQSFLPDGSTYSANFIQLISVGDQKYTVKNAQGDYSLESIEKMQKAAKSICQ